MPSQSTLQNNKLFTLFGTRLFKPDYWQQTRQSCAIAIAAGLFAAWLPLPLHSLIAIGLALVLRGYLPLAMAVVWISNPLTIAPMMYGAYHLGALFLGVKAPHVHHVLEYDFWALAPPLLLGALTLALLSAVLGWLATRLYWRYKISRAWQTRRQR